MTPPRRPPAASPDALARYYDAALATHGDTARGAGWPNEDDRRTRFDVMADIAGPRLAAASLCDVACGTGALLTHLAATGRAPARYLGVDISEAALDEARAKHPDVPFLTRDLLAAPDPALPEPFDYIVVNGLFTVRAEVDEGAMWDFMTATLARLWPFARRGMAFNVMSAVVDWTREDLFHVPQDRLCAFLFGLAGRRVVLRNDYDLYEYTAYVFREGAAER
ncbi:SAM-dependent methyltransferase [Acuticoccus sediminis]|uniref:SAM-dependent methyltransferase n=1 Tax=Acuticoccus sediminis TaxID=2184697 RepID=A0A8B2NH66_9HYPH|nr:class I SAM-dependent methyltransferase [Acuticoccus sediminis]RAH96568.1 SAM-dependent methyltransferase [Acuticoccus sediminis]